MITTAASRRRLAAACLAAAATAALCTSLVTPASAAQHAAPRSARTDARFVAASANPTNPLANRYWGVYEGGQEPVWAPYESATPRQQRALKRIALRPKAAWYGDRISSSDIAEKMHDNIASSTAGHPQALVQMTMFRVEPWERDAATELPTRAQIRHYKTWIDNAAAALGQHHVAIVLQPDGPDALQAPHHSHILSDLVRYAAQRFSKQKNTAVYIEAGSADWTRGDIGPALKLLTRGGIRGVRGFALNGTHYDRTVPEIRFGTRIVNALKARGYGTKHFVIDTAENGQGFTGKYWHAHPTGTDFNNAGVCTTTAQHNCVTLGIPPTYHVAAARWHLPATARAEAAKNVDAYLWFGRPWLYNQSSPFDMQRALAEARTTPFGYNGTTVG